MEQTAEQLERIRDFVAALRSGEYKQARGRMRSLRVDADGNVTSEVGYCCEGVAFERYGAQLGYTLTYNDNGDMVASYRYGKYNEEEFSSWTIAPPRFWQDMGMADPSHAYNGLAFATEQRSWEEYASLNDSGLTFDQIADLIQWQFLPVGNGDNGE